MPQYRVHRVNFFNFEPNAINCLCFDEGTSLLALSRADSSIEIWNLKETPFLERVISPSIGASVEAIVWCQGRLFSTGLAAYVLEHDINTLSTKHSLSVMGGPAWCMATNKDETLFATGTEEGYISLFAVNAFGFHHHKTFDKQEGRILCMSWHESGHTLATGSVDTIRVWDVENGHAITRILVSRIERNTETIVWCLAYLKDFTIVSGDSWGRTTFWDGQTGTQQSSSRVHNVDVLCLCADRSEQHIFVSGINPLVTTFSRVQTSDGRGGWVKSYNNTMHTHDVRAITKTGKYLVTGGVDCYLALTLFKKKKLCLKYHSMNKVSSVNVAAKERCLMFQYPGSIDIWQLGNTTEKQGINGAVLKLSKAPVRALQLVTKGGETIVCSALSENATWLAYATTSAFRLYSFSRDEDPVTGQSSPNLSRVRWLPEECNDVSPRCLSFTTDGNVLIIITSKNCVQLLRTNLVQPSMIHVFSSDSEDCQFLLTCSTNSDHFATATHSGKVTVYSIAKKTVVCCLPKHHAQATALSFHPTTNHLVVVYSDQKMVEYDITTQAYTSWSRKDLCQSQTFLNPHLTVTRITFSPLDPDLIILHDDDAIYFVSKNAFAPSSAKKKRSDKADLDCGDRQQVKTSRNYKHLLGFFHLEDDEMVSVEMDPSQILKALPPAYKAKKFGT